MSEIEEEARAMCKRDSRYRHEALVEAGEDMRTRANDFAGTCIRYGSPGWVTVASLEHDLMCDECPSELTVRQQAMTLLVFLQLERERLQKANEQLALTVSETVPEMLVEIEQLKKRLAEGE